MSDTSGKRLAQGREAPVLLIRYTCRECGWFDTLDAYNGPPSCTGFAEGNGKDVKPGKHLPVWMEALKLVAGGDLNAR